MDPGPGLRFLHERILRADPALFGKAAAPPAAPAQPPADLPVFTGREAELADTVARLSSATCRAGVAVVHGMPGVGKTSCALPRHQGARHLGDRGRAAGFGGYILEC